MRRARLAKFMIIMTLLVMASHLLSFHAPYMSSPVQFITPQLRKSLLLSQVSIRGRFAILNTLEILALDQPFDSRLDHVDVWHKSRGELRDDFCH